MEENEEKREEQEGDAHLQTLILTLTLFDLLWFRRLILLHPPPPPPPKPPTPPPPEVELAESSTASPPPPLNLLLRRRLHRRSLSDDLSPSPTSSMLQIRTPRLQTILSGKVSAISDEVPRFEAVRRDRLWRRQERLRRRRRRESSKSMSELEFEELKGFMDLGFTFSEVNADPRLMEIVPGLQRLKAAPEEEESSSYASADDMAVPRPYLSEAWDTAEEEEINQLRNFKILIGGGGGGGGGGRVDLKDQLRFWAHAVASTVR